MYSTIGVTQYADYDNCTSIQGNKVDSILVRGNRDKGRCNYLFVYFNNSCIGQLQLSRAVKSRLVNKVIATSQLRMVLLLVIPRRA